jgi:hypothetical protein
MFVLSKLEADARVAPQDLVKPPLAAVTEALEREYLDRVIPGLGLAVSIYDVLSIEGGHIYPDDGAAYFRVAFRLAVFRPIVGEILVGKILSASRCGGAAGGRAAGGWPQEPRHPLRCLVTLSAPRRAPAPPLTPRPPPPPSGQTPPHQTPAERACA